VIAHQVTPPAIPPMIAPNINHPTTHVNSPNALVTELLHRDMATLQAPSVPTLEPCLQLLSHTIWKL
jgi:hypothetical protein